MSREKNITADPQGVIDRLRTALAVRTDREVADLLGFTKAAFSERKRRGRLPFPEIELLCTRQSINIDWVMSGRGPIKRESQPQAGVVGIAGTSPGAVRQSVYQLAGAGGDVRIVEEGPVGSIWTPAEFAGPHIVPVRMRGMSMTPTIWEGAVVGVDTGDRFIADGDIHALWRPREGAVIKRLISRHDRIIIRSDNRDIEDDEVTAQELEAGGYGGRLVLGRIKWIIQSR